MDELEIEKLLASNDPDAIQKFLSEQSAADALAGDDDTPQDEETPPATPGTAAHAPVNTEPDPAVEALRRENAELQRQLEERERQRQIDAQTAADVEATQKKLELLTDQLTKAGIQPAQLPEEMELTEEELAELDEYGAIGSVTSKIGHKFRALQEVVATLQKQQAESKAAPAPQAAPVVDDPVVVVNKAIDATPGLRKVLDDPTLSQQAIDIDTRLKTDPKWQGKPMTERFAEVMKQMTPRLMKNQPKQHDNQDVPYSLSGVPGATQDVNATLIERFDGMTEAQISQFAATASQAELAALLSEFGH